MIASANDGKHPRSVDMRDRLGHLIESLLDVARNDEDVACVAEVEFFVNIDPSVEPITVVESRDAAHSLRTEARSRPVGCGRVEGSAHKGGLVVANLANVFAIGRLHKGVDAGESRLMTPAKERDIAVDNGSRSF